MSNICRKQSFSGFFRNNRANFAEEYGPLDESNFFNLPILSFHNSRVDHEMIIPAAMGKLSDK